MFSAIIKSALVNISVVLDAIHEAIDAKYDKAESIGLRQSEEWHPYRCHTERRTPAQEIPLTSKDIVGPVATLYGSDGPTNDWRRKPVVDNDITQPMSTCSVCVAQKVRIVAIMSATIKRLRRYVTYTLNDIFWRIDSKFVETECVSTDIDVPPSSPLNATESTCHTLPCGTKEWLNSKGQRHREGDLPAVEGKEATYWYKDSLQHRENGPALVWIGGFEWYLDGLEYTESEFDTEIARRKSKGMFHWYLEGDEYSEWEFNKEVAHRQVLRGSNQ